MKSGKKTKEHPSPQQAVQQFIATILDDVFKNHEIPLEVRRRAHEFSGKFEYTDATYLGPEARRAAGGEYDAWSDSIFSSIQAGDYREDMLRNFISHLGGFLKENRTDILFALVIEEITDGKKFVRYQLAEYLSPDVHKKHWSNYSNRIANGIDYPFFRALLDSEPEQGDIGVWYGGLLTSVYPYTGEFNDLIQVTRSEKERLVEPLDTFWLSAIKLEAEEPDQPHRLLFLAYPNHGTVASPKVGRAAAQEWRMLQLLRIAYRQVDHKIHDLDRRIAAQRVDILRDLGPGFLAHELHTHLANLYDLNIMLIGHVKSLLNTYPQNPDIQSTEKRLNQSANETTRIFQVVKGYNNLMRARELEKFTLIEVIDEVLALTRIRSWEYARAKVSVERKRMEGVNLETDHGLLLVVLVNVIINATQAIHEHLALDNSTSSKKQGDRIVILMESEPDDSQVHLLIANTGPAIAPELRERIFRRGFTTRSLGHGQGLYLCRQILNYLGGEIYYTDPSIRELFLGTAFHIKFPCNKKLKGDNIG